MRRVMTCGNRVRKQKIHATDIRVPKIAKINPDGEVVVLTMFDGRTTLSSDVAAQVRSHFGKTAYKTVIPRNVRVSEAPSHGKPVLLYDDRCAGSIAYIRLASEVIKREKALRAA